MPNEHTIAENLQRLIDAKDDISTAITNKGVTVPQGSGLEDFASLIGAISTGAEYCTLVNGASQSGNAYMINIEDETWVFGCVNCLTSAYYMDFTIPENFTPKKLNGNGLFGNYNDSYGGDFTRILQRVDYNQTNRKIYFYANSNLVINLTYYICFRLDTN